MDTKRTPAMFSCRTPLQLPHADQSAPSSAAAASATKGQHVSRRHSISSGPTVKWPNSIEGYLETLAAARSSTAYFRDTDGFRDRESWPDSAPVPSITLLNPRHSRLPSGGSSAGSARSRGGAPAAERAGELAADPGQPQRSSWEELETDVLDAAVGHGDAGGRASRGVLANAQQQAHNNAALEPEGPCAAALLRTAGSGCSAGHAGEAGPVPRGSLAGGAVEEEVEAGEVRKGGGLSPYSVLSPPSSPTTSSSAHALSMDEDVTAGTAAAGARDRAEPPTSLEARRARAVQTDLPSEEERAAMSSIRLRRSSGVTAAGSGLACTAATTVGGRIGGGLVRGVDPAAAGPVGAVSLAVGGGGLGAWSEWDDQDDWGGYL